MQISEDTLAAYVRASLALQGYALDEAQTAAVVLQFSRIALIASAFLDESGPQHAEPLAVFRP
jgi:pyrimidine deaminase RibD-like protein